MVPGKAGQIVRFHTPLPDENPDQLYVIIELFEDVENPRARIKALNTGLTVTPVNTVLLEDLEAAEVDTAGLMGQKVTIKRPDQSLITGRAININEKSLMLDLSKQINGVEANVWITIEDDNGMEHSGKLFVNPLKDSFI